MADDYVDIPTGQLDGFCRSVKALVEMLDGPAIATLEFPMVSSESGQEVGIKVLAFRCSNPDCDGKPHVEVEVQPAIRKFEWSQERSDDVLFGGGVPDDQGDA